MHCKNCHYSLVKLPEHRCPECGRAFDPDDPTSYDSPQDSSLRSQTQMFPGGRADKTARVKIILGLGGLLMLLAIGDLLFFSDDPGKSMLSLFAGAGVVLIAYFALKKLGK